MERTGICIGGPYAGRKITYEGELFLARVHTGIPPMGRVNLYEGNKPTLSKAETFGYVWTTFSTGSLHPPAYFLVPEGVSDFEQGQYVLDTLTAAYIKSQGE